MKPLSLSSKITTTFVVVSVAAIGLLYFLLMNLLQGFMLKSETEKSQLIAQTIEPVVAVNLYLDLQDELAQIAQQTADRPSISGLTIHYQGQVVWSKNANLRENPIITKTSIIDPVTKEQVGEIVLAYKRDDYYAAIQGLHEKLAFYMGGIALLFILFSWLIRFYLKPLGQIAEKVGSYVLGDKIRFSEIRMEPEIKAISSAFEEMEANIREYTLLLEQYKHSVDESAVVTKIDTKGTLIYANDEYKRLTHAVGQDIEGKKSFLVKHPKKQNGFYNRIWKTLQNKQIWKGVVEHKLHDGEIYYAKSTIVPMLDESGEVIEYISIEHDITQIVRQQEQISRQTTDYLTGLPNRIKLEEELPEFSEPKLAILSIDNYRVVKDYYGYSVAEQVLKDVAAWIPDYINDQQSHVYRLGAGEFAIVVEDQHSLTSFNNVCVDLIHKLESTQVVSDDDRIDLHVSCGLTANRENYLAYAALALQHAQDQGKITVLYEDEENLAEQYKNNLTWTKKIKQALVDERIALYAQPIINIDTHKVEKYECLVRLIDTDGKIISPFFFLEIAKKTKLYHKITKRIIELAFAHFSKIPDIEFSINLSPVDLLHEETVAFLKEQIQEYKIANRLVVEIIESEEIESFESVTSFINELKELGCKVAIDDFGTGYSNFSYLMQLNADYIKVDGSLVKDIDQDRHSQIISSTIINFADALDIKTIAEFVHNDSVRNKCIEIGFDYLQGFHLGEPVPIEDISVTIEV